MDKKLGYIKKLIRAGLPKNEVVQRFEKKFGELNNASVLYNSVISSEFSSLRENRPVTPEFTP
ncbi:hypothetical protein FACS189447_05510 [Spirochaetia bacterium]|nr:hypothetical protein FACS189447_05510 [Spirochaetia bacterium]